MFSVYVIIFEILIVILFGAFIRLDSATLDNVDYLIGSLVLLLGFAMISVARKFISWTSIANLLIILSINFQWNLLWFQLWKSCFTGFNTNVSLSVELLVNCVSSTLCCLLSFSDFIGKVSWNQLLISSLIQSIGFSLNSAVIIYGLKAFDGGGGIQIFFLSGLFGYSLWFIGLRSKEITITKPKYTYQSVTFGLIGLLLVLYGWPSFNVGGSLLSQSISTNMQSKNLMSNCAYINTLFTLTAAILSGFLYQTPTNKINVEHYIDAVINGGIIIASSSDVLLNPVGGLVLGCIASVTTVTSLKYLSTHFTLQSLSGSTFRLIFGFLSGIFASIIVASRNGLSPILAEDLLIKGAFVLAAIALTIGIGICFGVLSGLTIKYLPGPTKQDISNDQLHWAVKDEIIPLFPNSQYHKDVLNFNRLNNQLIAQIQKQQKDSNAGDHGSVKSRERQSEYVPPPRPPASPKSSNLHTIKKQTSSSISRIIGSDLKTNNKQDNTKPETSMQFHINTINQQQQYQQGYQNNLVQYKSNSSSFHSNFQKEQYKDEQVSGFEQSHYSPNQ